MARSWSVSYTHLYKVVEEAPQPDGSILVKILKQYNSAPVGDYLN